MEANFNAESRIEDAVWILNPEFDNIDIKYENLTEDESSVTKPEEGDEEDESETRIGRVWSLKPETLQNEDAARTDSTNPELDLMEVKEEEQDSEEEPAIKSDPPSADEDAVWILNPEFDNIDIKYENLTEHESSVTKPEVDASNADRQDEEEIFEESEFGSSAESEDNNDEQKRFPCKLCNYKTTQRCRLSAHMTTHRGEKPFSSKLCNYKAARKGDLSNHTRSHRGEKPFSCQLCSYKATQRGNLANHIRTHTGEKPFSCQLCSYKATQRGHLAIHIRTHTGEKPFSCQLCSYKATQRGNLAIHIRTHTGEKPFSCRLCSYKATQRGHISIHMRTHRGERSSKISRKMIRTHPKPSSSRMSLRSKTSDSKGQHRSYAESTSSDTD